ncbi:MAG: hypothetical protein NVV73_07795 [Cellvibrionaceae bacterium]|nr:hypothetical protein [Cellvibrionaceae bacterium]
MRRLVFVSMLPIALAAACQLAPQAGQERSRHQASHGASAGHRLAFIAEYDTNGDGQVTRAEFELARAARLLSMDKDSNGLVAEDEYIDDFNLQLDMHLDEELRALVAESETRFETLDTDKDGRVTWTEYQEAGEAIFNYFAEGGTEGTVAPGAAHRQWRPDQLVEGGTRRPGLLAKPEIRSLAWFIDAHDRDGDRQVMRSEYLQVQRERFERMDMDGSGWLASEEYVQHVAVSRELEAADIRARQVRQAKIRYGVLNADRDEGISLAEFAVSGARIFTGWDLNDDGVVSTADPLPPAGDGGGRMAVDSTGTGNGAF